MQMVWQGPGSRQAFHWRCAMVVTGLGAVLFPPCWMGHRPGWRPHRQSFAAHAIPRLKVSSSAETAKPAWTMARLSELCREQGCSSVLKSHGVAVMPGAFEGEMLEGLLDAFLGMEVEMLHDMRFGDLRVARTPYHLPYKEPFRFLPLLGVEECLRDVLTDYLGEDFELESAMVVQVDGGAGRQNAHLDTEDAGSVSVHVPLQPLHEGFAPLSFLVTTHEDPSILAAAAAPRSRRRDRRKELGPTLAHQRQRSATAKEEYFLQWDGDEVDLLGELDLRRGQGRCLIRSVRPSAEGLGLQPGDEVTHVNELDFVSWLQVKDFVPEFRRNLRVRVLRPVLQENAKQLRSDRRLRHIAHEHERPQSVRHRRVWLSGPRYEDKRLIGAPLNVGDALLYDSRTVHWGSSNREEESRYVLYLNFKKRDFVGTSPDELAISSADQRCRWWRHRFQEKLERELHYMEDPRRRR
ncbi:unnamed protein product [Durusdinium trenchii]|uniref:PDZ domain-containing protein n=1 Tax=Durusdinium trenchii TaxID=1381693 RepID=A0ABP0JJP2_9DINO